MTSGGLGGGGGKKEGGKIGEGRGWDPRRKGSRICVGSRMKGLGCRISKVVGSRRNREKIMQHCTIFHNPKGSEAGANKIKVGTMIKGYGSRKLKPSCPLPPPLSYTCRHVHSN